MGRTECRRLAGNSLKSVGSKAVSFLPPSPAANEISGVLHFPKSAPEVEAVEVEVELPAEVAAAATAAVVAAEAAVVAAAAADVVAAAEPATERGLPCEPIGICRLL